MEFDFDLKFLNGDANGISVWNKEFGKELDVSDIAKLSELIDELGRASCKSQRLGEPVTSANLLRGTDHTIYIICNDNMVIGILKIGYKKLFIHNLEHRYVEITPLCVLDFYIHENYQRKGIGKILMDYMLKCEYIEPRLIAYDAPSTKLLNFLNKHYGLKLFTPQNCNFVLYHDYFHKTDSYHYEVQSEIIMPYTANHQQQEIEENKANSEQSLKNVNNEIVFIENEQKIDKIAEIDEKKFEEVSQYEPESHQQQLDYIQKKIEQTKIAINEAEKKIYRHHLTNYTSSYGLLYPGRNKKSIQIRNIRKTGS